MPSFYRNPASAVMADERDLLDAIQHADLYGDQGWTLDDFKIVSLGEVPLGRIREYEDWGAWIDVDPEDYVGLSVEERLAKLAEFRGPRWAERAAGWLKNGVPPIVVIDAPIVDEHSVHRQIGDGRGRINFALAMGLKRLPVVLMKWKHPLTNPYDVDDSHAYMLYANPAEDDFSGAEEHSDERIRDLIEGPYPFNLIPMGERVEAHLNLGTKMRVFGLKTWSLRWKRREKRVYGHAASVVLQDVKFRVGQAGAALAARSKEGGKKTVHAFADGILVDSAPPHEGAGDNPPPGSVRIRYNPHPPDFHKRFMRMDPETGAWDIPVARCATLWLTSDWKLFAVGVVDL